MQSSFRWFFIFCMLLTFSTFAQKNNEATLLTVGPKKISVGEFLYHYNKNPVGADSLSGEASIKEYLQLFINYKLKVLAGEARGIDTTVAFREELAGYRKLSAQATMTDKNATEALIKEAYERCKIEVNASHILLEISSNAAPGDTLRVYQDAIKIRERILAGEKFEDLVKQYSKDPYAAQNGGSLGWFTGLQMVYPVENAAFTLSKGQLSMPIRTKFGYHILRTNDRRDAQGQVQVGHLFTRGTEAKTKIDEAYAELQRGVPFEQVVRQFSEDATTRNNGGQMQAFGTGQMLPVFEEAAFGLKREGSYSAPFQTTYGWHIVKLIKKIPVPDFADMSGFLRTKVLSDARSEVSKSVVQKRIRKENAFSENSATITQIIALADDQLPLGKWKAPTDKAPGALPLFTFKKDTVRAEKFFAFAQTNQRPQAGAAPASMMQAMLSVFADAENIAYEEAHLEEKNPDFKALVQEYHDGILLFQMLDENVQGKSLQDTSGLRTFFNQNRNRYQMPARVLASVLNAASPQILDQATKMLSKKPYLLNRKVADITFKKGETTLTQAQKEKLFDLIVILGKNAGYQVEISGHADTSEPDSCSAGRLRSVVKHLASQGNIAMTRVVEIDENKFKPVSGIDRDKNRRVSFLLSTTAKQDVIRQFNTNKPENLLFEEAFFKKGENKYVDGVDWKPGKIIVEKGGRTVRIDIQQVESARPKTLSEARGSVLNDYQVFLENNWLGQLKKQFPVVVNEEEFNKIVK